MTNLELFKGAIRHGLELAGAMGDPDQITDYVESVTAELMSACPGRVGWLIRGESESADPVTEIDHADRQDDVNVWTVATRADVA